MGGGLIHVACASGRGRGEVANATRTVLEQLFAAGVQPDEIAGAVLIIETHRRNRAAIALMDAISNIVKRLLPDEAVIVVSAPFSHDVVDDGFSVYMAVRQ